MRRAKTEGGVWVTIKGSHIFIKDGETSEEALERYKLSAEKAEKQKAESGGATVCKTEKEGNAFKKALVEAKGSLGEEMAWRVDTDYHNGKDYVGTKTFVSQGGSTYAVKDGDIISVCRKNTDQLSGHELLEKAVKAGGKKLDSFDGNFIFYVRNGFEPVSWTPFDEKYKPNGWDSKRDKKEAVIFFKYTGKKYGKQTAEFWEHKKAQFYKNVKASADYDSAMEARDKELKK